jgi:hypothetical protein
MRAAATLLGLCLCGISGCGSEATCYPVSGYVTYRGQPLAGGLIVFSPDFEKGASGPTSRAIIKTDGSFDLATDDRIGAVRGWHRITIAAPMQDSQVTLYRDFPEKFHSPVRSGLGWEVQTESENHLLIELNP